MVFKKIDKFRAFFVAFTGKQKGNKGWDKSEIFISCRNHYNVKK